MAAKLGKLTPQANAATAASTAAAFYAVAMERSIELPTQNYSAGNTLNFSLPPSGIGTYVTVSFKGTLTVTSGATASQPTASPWYPYNILNIAYSDYLAFPRCNASGWQLKELEMMRAFQFDPANVYGVTPTAGPANGTAPISSAAAAVSFANQIPTAAAEVQRVASRVILSRQLDGSLHRQRIEGSRRRSSGSRVRLRGELSELSSHY